jgi:hypothetical protein
MATRKEVQDRLDAGLSYEAAAQQLGIPAGQAYLIATGRPADTSDEPATQDDGGGPAGGSDQPLADPPHHNPTSSAQVHDWMAGRARADEQMRTAAQTAADQDGQDP